MFHQHVLVGTKIKCGYAHIYTSPIHHGFLNPLKLASVKLLSLIHI